MGTVFKYIADDILAHHSRRDVCGWCELETELFTFYWDDGEGMSDQSCVKCIKTMPLSFIYGKTNERLISSLVNQRYPKGTKSQDQRFALTVEMCDEYRRTPRLPNFRQNDDWPSCCGDFTEFIGDAGESYTGPYEGFEWRGYEKDMAIEQGIEGTMGGEDRVSLFRCQCEKKYWTFQCT